MSTLNRLSQDALILSQNEMKKYLTKLFEN